MSMLTGSSYLSKALRGMEIFYFHLNELIQFVAFIKMISPIAMTMTGTSAKR